MINFSKKHLQEEANKCASVEIYVFKENSEYRVHTDTVDYIDISIDSLPDEVKCDYYEMGEDEYNRTICANCGEYVRFDELYEGDDAKVMVIILPHNWTEEE